MEGLEQYSIDFGHGNTVKYHFFRVTGKHNMVLFLCSPEQVNCSSLSCCVLCMCTQHIKGWMLPADGASWRGGKRFVTTGGVQAWSFTCRCCSQLVFLLVVNLNSIESLPLSLCLNYTLGISCNSIRKVRRLFCIVNKGGGISSVSVEGCGSSILGKGEKESACLTHHAKTLGSNLSIKTDNYLSLITISLSFFLLKMWEHNTLWNSILMYILVSVLQW